MSVVVVHEPATSVIIRTGIIQEGDNGVPTEALNNEIARATAAELVIAGNLTAEVTRATAAEQGIEADLLAEAQRAVAAESLAMVSFNGKLPVAGAMSYPITAVYADNENVKTGDVRRFGGIYYTANFNHNTGGAGFNANNWSVFTAASTPSPGALIPAENYTPGGNTGLFRPVINAEVPYRNAKRLLLWNLASQGVLSKIAGTGTPTLVEKTDSPVPPVHDRYVEVDSGVGNVEYAVTFPVMATPVNLADQIVRYLLKVSVNSPTALQTTNFKIQVSSDGAFTNYKEWTLWRTQDTHLRYDETFRWSSFHTAAMAQVGTGTDLTAINRYRIVSKQTGTESWKYALPIIDYMPNPNKKASFTFWVDDGGLQHYQIWGPKLAKYGFKAVMAPNIASMIGNGITSLSTAQMRILQRALGWQVATHAYSNDEHQVPTSTDQLAQQFQRSRSLQSILRVWGGEDLAYWGGLPQSDYSYERVRQFFRSARSFTQGDRQPETGVPADQWNWRCYGVSEASDTFVADWKPYIDIGIKTKSNVGMAWHNGNNGVELDALLTYLDANRDVIEVRTQDEVMRDIYNQSEPDLRVSTIIEKVNTVAASGAALTLPDTTVATIHDITVTANCAITLPALAAGKSFVIRLTQGTGGNFAVTFNPVLKWAGGTAPTFSTVAGKQDVLTVISIGGSAYTASALIDVR